MGFFKKIFKASPSENLPKEDLEAVILYSVHKVLKDKISTYPILKRNESLVIQLISHGFLRFSTLQENLNKEFLLPELKEILKENDLKVSGKKDDLVERIISNINPEKLQNPKSKLERILLTDKGRDFVILETDRFNKELEKFYDRIYNLLFEKKFEEAFRLVSSLNDSSIKSFGFGKDWSQGFSENEMNTTKLLREFNFSEDILNNGVEEIRSELATYNLLRFNYFGNFKIEDRIIQKFPDFESKQIKEYLEDQPDGLAGGFDPTNQKDIVKLFIHYIQFTCHNEAQLQEILSYRNKPRSGYKGVEVLSNRQDCLKCSKIGSKKYTWKEIHEIPKIPFYPGCTCNYLSIIES
ncbi:SAP domain-containing protein [Algoriphagus persicinus]|uniref:SAP domain-containing protein n=1 Tax=Algoriphagus persicinus TaxID=3108754 RepID=UPI002B3B5C3B|nr:SAP domain-containing protein [Algoriphagus sp. E1-3-M2]MEB2786011.1 SAP domain-containing protein [Algoriphagus sp. E1-3-M2]